MSDIFLCHSSRDKVFVRKLDEQLRALGFSTWFDDASVGYGESISEEVARGIAESSVFMPIMSRHWSASKWAMRETAAAIHHAIEWDRTILPVRIGTCTIPSLLKDIRYVDFCPPAKFSDGLHRLYERLGVILGKRKIRGHAKFAHERLVFSRWEVQCTLESRTRAIYRTSVLLLNNTAGPIRVGPMHSFWTSQSDFEPREQIRAFDEHGPLKLGPRIVQTGSACEFAVLPRSPIPRMEEWSYWWEVDARDGFKDLERMENYDFRGESPVRELLIRIVLPEGGQGRKAVLVNDRGTSSPLRWSRVDGRDAIVVRRTESLPGHGFSVQFSGSWPRRRKHR